MDRQKEKIFLTPWLAIFSFVFFLSLSPCAFAAEDNTVTKDAGAGWSWIFSDQKYGKFYSPANIKVISETNGVATRISAWIKTLFSPSGAEETIENYEISQSIPDAKVLSYSLSLVEISPQERTIEYVQENFYDKMGKAIWQKIYEPRTVKEINSQSFDEDFYAAIVDQVFRIGEMKRKKAPDRWISLWTAVSSDNSTTTVIADTTTMRLRGDNLIYWEWAEAKNAGGEMVEVKFMKKTVNLPQGTEKIIACKSWHLADGWKDITASLTDTYTAIPKGSNAEKGLVRLRAWQKGYSTWLNRYRTDIVMKKK